MRRAGLTDDVGEAAVVAVERAVLARVAERGAAWFPGAAAVPPRLQLLSSRPRARLYTVALGDDPERPRILAKVRKDGPAGGTGQPGRGRPSLSAQPLGAAELAGLEFAGLRGIADMVEAEDPRFGAVRPLDHLPEHATILMEFVEAPTLRSQLVKGSRLTLGPRTGRSAEDGTSWERVGAWLALYQQSMSVDGLPARQHAKAQVVEMFESYARFLGDRLGPRAVGDLAHRGAELAASSLPDSLPMAVGHGDYAPRNVFRCPDGRVTVFDPLPRWAVPTYEDLCRFLVNVRLTGVQLHTHGAAYSAAWVESLERDAINGYRAEGGEAPEPAFRCYQLLILLDKWSALVGPVGGLRGRLHRASLASAAGYLRGQAGRLLELAGT